MTLLEIHSPGVAVNPLKRDGPIQRIKAT